MFVEKRYTVVPSELEASMILTRANVGGFDMSTKSKTLHEAGNYIILLAEKIKAERMVSIMDNNQH
jgi:hypothetical protein